MGGLRADGSGDGDGKFLAVGGGCGELAFRGIAEVAAFQQDAGDLRIPGDALVEIDECVVVAVRAVKAPVFILAFYHATGGS